MQSFALQLPDGIREGFHRGPKSRHMAPLLNKFMNINKSMSKISTKLEKIARRTIGAKNILQMTILQVVS